VIDRRTAFACGRVTLKAYGPALGGRGKRFGALFGRKCQSKTPTGFGYFERNLQTVLFAGLAGAAAGSFSGPDCGQWGIVNKTARSSGGWFGALAVHPPSLLRILFHWRACFLCHCAVKSGFLASEIFFAVDCGAHRLMIFGFRWCERVFFAASRKRRCCFWPRAQRKMARLVNACTLVSFVRFVRPCSVGIR